MIHRVLTLITIGLLGFTHLRADPSWDISWDIAKVGDKPYPVSGTATDGTAVSLEAFKGRPVLLYFFATKAGAGTQELRMIKQYVWSKFEHSGLVIIGVGREAQMPELTALAKSMQITFPLLPDPEKEIFRHFATRGHPRTYLVGKDGTIKLTSLGYSDDDIDRISDSIARELKQ